MAVPVLEPMHVKRVYDLSKLGSTPLVERIKHTFEAKLANDPVLSGQYSPLSTPCGDESRQGYVDAALGHFVNDYAHYRTGRGDTSQEQAQKSLDSLAHYTGDDVALSTRIALDGVIAEEVTKYNAANTPMSRKFGSTSRTGGRF